MRTIRLTALLSLALTMGLVTMDAAHASPIVQHAPGKHADTAHVIARGAVEPDWGPARPR